ncbi:hypothetical protein N658DRAFT_474406 [Parathielavia hyrcaniae]|uniref:Uncharacterized protein n=1 Tax=Parathielavia hyrcaniae TaxID=113614 RepID=A0AAN6PXF5_9PEZI|nr:hypothetical protein N658DRAFT_474406 [Parathielavia hyrcaniae]
MYTIPTPHKAESGAPPKDDQDDGGTGVIFVDPGPAATETATESAEPSPPGGLPQGAIIGIAVTCSIIGLLLIGGLVWFLLRRRRQAQAMHAAGPPYGSGSRADELMAEKEAAAAADVDASPHSPYSDDGAPATAGPNGTYPNGASHGGEAVAAGAVGTAAASSPAAHSRPLPDAPRSFTPYSDRPGAAAAGTPSVRAASVAQADEPQVTVPSATPGRATPRVPIAHLVEDGMTEDEIRRLEEEERQLDAAIEQAGRR